jgi:hypothetical protein
VTKDEAQRSPSALLRAMSLSNGRWTFYEAVKVRFSANERLGRSFVPKLAFQVQTLNLRPFYLTKNG